MTDYCVTWVWSWILIRCRKKWALWMHQKSALGSILEHAPHPFSFSHQGAFKNLHGASFHIKRNAVVAVWPLFYMTTACWCPWLHKCLTTGSRVKYSHSLTGCVNISAGRAECLKTGWCHGWLHWCALHLQSNYTCGLLSCVCAYDFDDFFLMKASSSTCRFIAALLGSVKPYGYMCLL